MVSFLALEECVLEAMPQDPRPMAHLTDPNPRAYNIDIKAELISNGVTTDISLTNAK